MLAGTADPNALLKMVLKQLMTGLMLRDVIGHAPGLQKLLKQSLPESA